MNCDHLGFYFFLSLPFLAMMGRKLGALWQIRMGSPGNRGIDQLFEALGDEQNTYEIPARLEVDTTPRTPYRTPDVLDEPKRLAPSLAPFTAYARSEFSSEPCPKCGKQRVLKKGLFGPVTPYLDYDYRPAVVLGPVCKGRASWLWAWWRCREMREHFHVRCRACLASWLMATKDAP